MYTKPTAPRSIGGVLDGAFSLWMPALKVAWPLVFIPRFLGLIAVLPQISSLSAPHQGLLPTLSGGSVLGQFLGLVVGILSLGFYNAAIARVDDTASNGNMTLGQSISIGFKFWGRAFLVGLIMSLAIVPAVIPIIMIAVSVAKGQPPSLGGGAFMIAYGLFLAFLLGRVFLALPLVVLEDQGAWESIRTSWRLTRGHWWRCAAIFTVLAIIAYVAFIVLGGLLAILGLKGGLSGATVMPRVIIASQAVASLISVLFTPLFLAGTLSMYYDLKLRREGGDLAGRIDALAPNKI